jgi:hypothetical protein
MLIDSHLKLHASFLTVLLFKLRQLIAENCVEISVELPYTRIPRRSVLLPRPPWQRKRDISPSPRPISHPSTSRPSETRFHRLISWPRHCLGWLFSHFCLNLGQSLDLLLPFGRSLTAIFLCDFLGWTFPLGFHPFLRLEKKR